MMPSDEDISYNKIKYIFIIITCSVINFYHRLLGGYGRPLTPFKSIEQKIEFHNTIIAGTATQMSYNYRVLVPYLNEIPITILDLFVPYNYAFVISYAIFEFVSILALISGMYIFLKIWYSSEQSLIGILIMSISLTTTMTFSFTFHPWSFAEGAIIIIGMYMVYHNKFRFVILTSVLAILNRPSGVVLPVIYVLSNFNYRQLLIGNVGESYERLNKTLVLFFTTFIPFAYLQFVRTIDSHDMEFVVNNILNRYAPVYGQDWLASVFALFAFLGLLWLFVIIGYPTLPRFIKRSSLVLLLYIPLIIFTGDPTELRLLIPLYPFVIPAIVNVIIADRLLLTAYSERTIGYLSVSGIILSLLLLISVIVISPERITFIFDSYTNGYMRPSSVLEINIFRIFYLLTGGTALVISLWTYFNRSKLTSSG